jgi:hypothetical protein
VSPSAAGSDTGKPHKISGTLAITDASALQYFKLGDPVYVKMFNQADVDSPYFV